jgi:hypothetical protein
VRGGQEWEVDGRRLSDGPGVRDFARLDGAQLIGMQRNDGQRSSFECHEFQFVTFVAVDQNNRADVTGA